MISGPLMPTIHIKKGGGVELDKSSKLNLSQVDSCSSHKCKTPYKYGFDFCSDIFRANDFNDFI